MTLPRLPEPPPPYSFPLIATLAPVIGSLAMWAVTQSPFALVFAALGPVVALGSFIDARVQAARRRRRGREDFESSVRACATHIEAEKVRILTAMRRAVRAGRRLSGAPLHDPERWRHGGGPVPISLGVGTVHSGIRLRSPGETRDSDRAAQTAMSQALEGLREAAAEIDEAPVIVDARMGIGVCGPAVARAAVMRGLAAALADTLAPDAVRLTGDGGCVSWQRLPHYLGPSSDARRMEFTLPATGAASAERVVLVSSEHHDDLPRDCRLALRASGGMLEVLRHPSADLAAGFGQPPAVFAAQFVTEIESEALAATLADAARAERRGSLSELPESVSIEEMWSPETPRDRGLAASFLAGDSGPLSVDLVRDGPHCVIGGTTGTGKSELLVSWVLAMAVSHPPESVNFLLVDFKGGSSFGAVEHLPHSVGLITDLDSGEARRALESLRAELRHRERTLASCGLRSIDEVRVETSAVSLPRLVVVVDEFAAMVSDFPELHSLFADIAARGRSLGVHLILCTQRPSGVVRDSVMANCTLRLSLRVNNSADSLAVVGTGAAAELPSVPLGRCLISIAGAPAQAAQVALSGEDSIAEVRRRWPRSIEQRRPWKPPLPAVVPWDAIQAVAPSAAQGSPPEAIALGLLDTPEEQSQPVASWRPRAHGNLMVIGGQGSGRTTLLRLIAASHDDGAVVRIPAEIESAWDCLELLAGGALWHDTAARQAPGGVPVSTIVIDDVDALLARFPEPYAHEVAERLTMLLRDAPAAGLRVALTTQRVTAGVQALLSLCDARMLLRLPSRQDHVMAGGAPGDYDAALPPGAGWWMGHRLQVAWREEFAVGGGAAVPALLSATRSGSPVLGEFAAVVTTRPEGFLRLAREHDPAVDFTIPQGFNGDAALRVEEGRAIPVADPQHWQAQWGAITALRREGPVLFDRCTPSELRAVSGSSALPPPIGRVRGGAWSLGSEGSIARVQLPPGF